MNDIHPIIRELLNKRGIKTEEEVQEFLSPTPKKTYDPFLLLNMKEGVDLILSTINKKGKICIYGDYDADGITSICVLKTILSELTETENIDYYIPSRFQEGYGLNKIALKKIKEKGTDLLITVDCGSNSRDEVFYANEIGLDIIVTDHHSITEGRSECILINPKQPECPYPFKNLAGCGVAFKLAQAIREKADLPRPITNSLLDIVGIGTIGDIVPLLDENRTLAKYGIYEINKSKRPGLTKLIGSVSLKGGELGSDQVAFGIVPHLNAAGRMKDASVGVDLLLAKDEDEAQTLSEELIMHNRERKRVQEETFRECLGLKEIQCPDSLFPVIRDDNAHEGIAGIVAGKLKDVWQKPVIIVTPSDGSLKGTGRSIDKIDMFRALEKHKELFERFGGHQGACGFHMKEENLHALRKALNEDIEAEIKVKPGLLEPEIQFDMDIEGKDITLLLAELMEQIAPFGSMNRRPLLRMKNITVSRPAFLGQESRHARFEAVFSDGTSASCILFNKAEDHREKLLEGMSTDIYGSMNINTFNRKKKVQIIVEDMI